MTSRDFCYWLQGYFEISKQISLDGQPILTDAQVVNIEKHLALVFIHEIDPSAGGPAEQAKLNAAHSGPPPAWEDPNPTYRC